jgi:hypothetical protein
MTKYSVVFLSHGQQAPCGSTGIALHNGGIVLIHKDDAEKISCTADVLKGFQSPTDKIPAIKYNIRDIADKEIEEYNWAVGSTSSGIKIDG